MYRYAPRDNAQSSLFYQIAIAKVNFRIRTESAGIDTPLDRRRYRSAAPDVILCANGLTVQLRPHLPSYVEASFLANLIFIPND